MQEKIKKIWTLVDFMMKVLNKSEELMKSREELILTQATKLNEFRDEAEESLKMMNESLYLLQLLLN